MRISWERWGFIDAAITCNDELPDGALMQVLADLGITCDEIEAYCEMKDKPETEGG